MAKQLIQPLEVANRIDEVLGSAAQVSKIQMALIEVVRALATFTCRRRRQPTESVIPHKSHEDARLEFDRFLYW